LGQLRSLRLVGPQARKSRGATMGRSRVCLQQPPHDLQRRAGHRESSRRLRDAAGAQSASAGSAEAKARALQRSAVANALPELRLVAEQAQRLQLEEPGDEVGHGRLLQDVKAREQEIEEVRVRLTLLQACIHQLGEIRGI